MSHPTATDLRGSSDLVTAWALNHFAKLPELPTGRAASRSETEALLREPPPEQGQPFAEVLDEFTAKVLPRAVLVNHPRFLAFIPGAPNFLSVLGDWLCASANFFAGVWLEASGPAQVELLVLDWFKEFLGCPPESGGILCGGGSEATLTALVAARERLPFGDRHRAVLYVAEQRHWCVDRAARIMGLAPNQVRPLPCDRDFRLQPGTVVEAVRHDRDAGLIPWALAVNAGTTNTGTVDPLDALADVCAELGLWLHVDAAYGWAAVLTAEGKAQLKGIGRADSLVLDPHKWFGQTFEVGCVLVREPRLLEQAFSLRPEYMQDVEPNLDEVNFADRGLALTRRFRALKVWLSVKVLGVGWYRGLVERCCALARFAEELLRRTPGFEILSPSQLSIVCFRHVKPGLNEEELNVANLALVDRLRATQKAFISSTKLRGRVALRFCFVNWRTTASDVEAVVALLAALS